MWWLHQKPQIRDTHGDVKEGTHGHLSPFYSIVFPF
jgi:hypothetical protein